MATSFHFEHYHFEHHQQYIVYVRVKVGNFKFFPVCFFLGFLLCHRRWFENEFRWISSSSQTINGLYCWLYWRSTYQVCRTGCWTGLSEWIGTGCTARTRWTMDQSIQRYRTGHYERRKFFFSITFYNIASIDPFNDQNIAFWMNEKQKKKIPNFSSFFHDHHQQQQCE